jgi:LAO/AO transport system kinase
MATDDLSQEAAELANGVQAGDRRALARAITLAESTRIDHRQHAESVLAALADPDRVATTQPAAGSGVGGGSLRIGISGPPGVGKSTFIEAFGLHVVGRGHRMAVLAVDPSSSVSGGSILGDKTRMAGLSRHESAFVRPSPGGGELGGVARRTRDAMTLCEAAGFDVVVVETIGVGQSEVTVSEMVDAFVVLVSPGGGDELQGIKRGIMELADLVVVTKADGDLAPAAGRSVADYRNALGLLRPRWQHWRAEVLACSAATGSGIAEVWDALERFASALGDAGEISAHRAAQARNALWSELRSGLIDRLAADPEVAIRLTELEHAVAAGTLTPSAAARQVLTAWESGLGRQADD